MNVAPLFTSVHQRCICIISTESNTVFFFPPLTPDSIREFLQKFLILSEVSFGGGFTQSLHKQSVGIKKAISQAKRNFSCIVIFSLAMVLKRRRVEILNNLCHGKWRDYISNYCSLFQPAVFHCLP